MEKVRSFSWLGLLSSMLLLTSCAPDQIPLGWLLIHPELDDSGYMQELVDRNGGQSMPLFDALVKQGVSEVTARMGLAKFEEFRGRVTNTRHLALIDMTLHSGRPRFFLVDTASGKVDALVVAHGEGSDPKDTGYARYFSNIPNSRMTSLGSYLVQEKYRGKHGVSVRMDGLEASNSNVRDRDIVLHSGGYVRHGQGRQGRSWGCPAIPVAWMKKAVERLADGAFLYIYGVNERDTSKDAQLLEQWNLVPRSQWMDEGE